MKKRLVFAVVTIIVACSLVVPAFANQTVNMDHVNEVLLERNYPQHVLDRLSDETKIGLYSNSALSYMSSTCLNYDEETGTYSDVSNPQQRGHIGDDELELTFIYSAAYEDENEEALDYIQVTFVYDWLNVPAFRWQDPVAVSWDDEYFRMIPGSFSKADYYYNTIYDCWYTYATSNSPSDLNDAGVSWYANLAEIVMCNRLTGSAEFQIEPVPEKQPLTSVNSIIYGKYIHPKVSIGCSVVVSKYGTFDVSVDGNYDEMATSDYITF